MVDPVLNLFDDNVYRQIGSSIQGPLRSGMSVASRMDVETAIFTLI
jgi:hypothetical protein